VSLCVWGNSFVSLAHTVRLLLWLWCTTYVLNTCVVVACCCIVSSSIRALSARLG
jgi:hypothetical protein